MELESNVEKLLRQRYYKPGESWSSLVGRVTEAVYRNDAYEHRLQAFDYLLNRIFLPNSPTLVNAGTRTNGCFACFVVGPTEDNLEDHFKVLSEIAKIAKKGGGCGFTGSAIRPAGSPVAGSTHGYSYGPNKWAGLVSTAMDIMTQSGFRKMALMYTLDVDHPDILDFINLKQSGDERTNYNFNQSVMISDAAMDSAINRPFSKQANLLDHIAISAWQNGEPGILFGDRINYQTPYSYTDQKIYGTNPCGEQPLPPYGSCNLGSINLANPYFLTDDKFDFDKLKKVTKFATRFLDNVGTLNEFPTTKFADWYTANRPIGIGVMGFADLLLNLGITYGSLNSISILSAIMETIKEASYKTSEELGKERGVPEMCQIVGALTGHFRRNITTVSIAPTGSISLIANCSSGIEPIFSEIFNRTDERGQIYSYTHPLANEDYFVSAVGANQPSAIDQVRIQAAAQVYTDSGISKTINFRNEASVSEIKDAIIYAYEMGCKGITVYRDGSRNVQVLNSLPIAKPPIDVAFDPSCPTGVCSISS